MGPWARVVAVADSGGSRDRGDRSFSAVLGRRETEIQALVTTPGFVLEWLDEWWFHV